MSAKQLAHVSFLILRRKSLVMERFMGVSCRTVASTELILSSSRCSECEIFCVGSDEDVCVSPVSVVSSLARLERLQDH